MEIKLHSEKHKLPLQSIRFGEDTAGVLIGLKSRKHDGVHSYWDPVYPEIALATAYKGSTTIVEIEGRSWRVFVERHFDDGIPGECVVTFINTDEPTTANEPPGRQGHWFGQPTFVQSPVFPHVDGRSAMLLCCIESGWGDAGNENIFVGLDADGYPCGIYYEYSCC